MAIANILFQQHKRRLYTWTSPDGQHWNKTDFILCSKNGEALYSQQKKKKKKKRLGADCGSDNEFLTAKFRLKLKKVEKTIRPFRYDLNWIPYNYKVEVRNKFKGLDLIECLMNYEWKFMTLYKRQGSRPSLRKRNKKRKTAVWGGLTDSCEKKRSEKQRRKEKINPFECRVPKNSKER